MRPWAFAAPCLLILCASASAFAADRLGTASDYAVLGAMGVSNTGITTIHGDVGVYPGSSITDAGEIILTGAFHQTDADAQQAQIDAALGYVALAVPQALAIDLSGVDLGTLGVLNPGIYSFASSAQLTGALTLDFGANPLGEFIFQIGSTLTTASGSSISVLNGGATSGIFWQVGSSATLGTSTLFAGNILADQSITLTTGAKILCGRAIALNGAVTMDGNTVSADCAGDGALGSGRSDFGSRGYAGIEGTAVPEPAAWALMISGFGLSGVALRRRRVLAQA